ncbi:DNA-3-methyladenine glycosylase 2 family protein [Verrucomicrobia bacterium S94]|nr:DNA-3-methyladenine glycosylase 2 family protein [Verrucomicrobia bacterium S94]
MTAAEKHLAKVDPIMAELIRIHGPCPIPARKTASLFHMLASSIMAQQLSVKAASTIQGRVQKLCGKPLTPGSVTSVTDDQLRAAGLSRSKAVYIRNIAEAVQNGLTKKKLQTLTDKEAIERLTAIKGIGVWTAEMYLIFGLKRPDILSLGDAGLQRAARELYNQGQIQNDLLPTLGKKWKPYRSTASWYLWQALNNKPL